MTFSKIKRYSKRTIKELTADIKNHQYSKVLHYFTTTPKKFIFKYPRNISIEPISSCNLKCEFCSAPPHLLGRPRTSLKYSQFVNIVDDIKDMTHHLWLFLAGEPFLNPEFPKMVAYATKNNLHTTTSSNGNLITQGIAKKIVAAKLDKLILSLDGTSPQTYETMRVNGNYFTVLENIKNLVNEKKKQHSVKPEIELQFLNSKINAHESEKFNKLAKSLGVDTYAVKTLAIPSWILDPKTCQKIEQKYLPEKGVKRYNKEKCLIQDETCSFTDRSFIFSNGDVAICCYDISPQYKMGNVFKQSFKEIWTSDKYAKVRKMMSNRKLPLCKKCGETKQLY